MSSPENSDAEIICQCFQVSDKTIKGHIKAGDLREIEDVTETCGAGGGCQSCHLLLQLFIDQHHNPEKPTKPENSDNDGGAKKRGFFSKLFQKY